MRARASHLVALAALLWTGDVACRRAPSTAEAVKPSQVTARVTHDPDDPAIWIDAADPSRSLVIGTDKDADGALVAFDLAGRVVKTVPRLKRPNNVDVEYGLLLGGRRVDVAVVTERLGDTIRVFSVPALEPIDGGGIPVFVGESQRAPMGIALYKRPSDGTVFAIVGRKTGPTCGYLWQYRLEDDGAGRVKATRVRAFGAWSGKGEIEAIAVDDALGAVYYSDERVGIREYRADPDDADADDEVALFGTDGFADDREGISIYARPDGSGYILVSDQQADRFQVFAREHVRGPPHDHPRLAVVSVSAHESDGSDVTSAALGSAFPTGLFVAMSTDGSFHLYSWDDISPWLPARPRARVDAGTFHPQ
jgi:3-phytase